LLHKKNLNLALFSLVFVASLLIFQNCSKDAKYDSDLTAYMASPSGCPAGAAQGGGSEGDQQRTSNGQTSTPGGGRQSPPNGQTPPSGANQNPCGDSDVETGVIDYEKPDLIHLTKGQTVTFKISLPKSMLNPDSFDWYIHDENDAFSTFYGKIFFKSGFIYLTLGVNTFFQSTTSVKLLFYDRVRRVFLDQNGITISLNSDSSQIFKNDFIDSLCEGGERHISEIYFSKTNSLEPLFLYDSAAGIKSAACYFGTTRYNCFKISTWPSNWNKLAVQINITNRCNQKVSRKY
jgi:hypothetical protein